MKGPGFSRINNKIKSEGLIIALAKIPNFTLTFAKPSKMSKEGGS